jgi:hypothetical protein
MIAEAKTIIFKKFTDKDICALFTEVAIFVNGRDIESVVTYPSGGMWRCDVYYWGNWKSDSAIEKEGI